jgi:hypothetical protein
MPLLPSSFDLLCMVWDKVPRGEEISVKEVRHMAECLQMVDELFKWDNFLKFLDIRGLLLLKGRGILIPYHNPREWIQKFR